MDYNESPASLSIFQTISKKDSASRWPNIYVAWAVYGCFEKWNYKEN